MIKEIMLVFLIMSTLFLSSCSQGETNYKVMINNIYIDRCDYCFCSKQGCQAYSCNSGSNYNSFSLVCVDD